MTALRNVLLSALVAAALLSFAARAFAVGFIIYPATVKLVVQAIPDQYGDQILTKKVGNKELINLALGRPLDTAIDKNTEILAGAGTFADEAAESKLIVFDPSQNGVNQVKATIGTIDSIDFTNAYLAKKSQGAGFGTATWGPTTLGNPAQNGLLQSTIIGSGSGSGQHISFGPAGSKISGKGTVSGRLRFVFTDAGGTHTFDGIIIKGQAKASGKPLGSVVVP
jgi:hypothetical protein